MSGERQKSHDPLDQRGVFASRSKYEDRLPPPGGSEYIAELQLAPQRDDKTAGQAENNDDGWKCLGSINQCGIEAPKLNFANWALGGPER